MSARFMTESRPGVGEEVAKLGPWFHNLHLPDGTQTAPDHPLGDFPSFKWRSLAPALPEDLSGWRVLDVGCNAGYYSIQLAKRGAEVTSVDVDPHFVRQADWAVRKFGLSTRIQLKQAQVYEIAKWTNKYDLILFMGVFYHLRYPLLALDILAAKTKRLMVFQTLTMPGEDVLRPPEDQDFDDRTSMNEPGWPKMAFIEGSLAGDPTNWWAPNHACVEAMLRSCGMEIHCRPAHEIYLCRPLAGRLEPRDGSQEAASAAERMLL